MQAAPANVRAGLKAGTTRYSFAGNTSSSFVVPTFRSAARQIAGNPPPTIDYQQQIHTILAARCLNCHSAERRSGGLSLAAYADVLEGGRSGAAIVLATPAEVC